MRVSSRIALILTATLVVFVEASPADTVTLVNGAAIDGIVTGRHEGFIILTIGNVGTMKIPEGEVKKIHKNPRTGYLDPEKGVKKVKKIPTIEPKKDEADGENTDSGEVAAEADGEEAALDPAVAKVIKELTRDLTAQKTRTRTRAERRLMEFGDAAIPDLLKIAEHPFVRTRVAVFRLLKRSKDSRVIEPALTGLADSDKFVRKLAWETLRHVSGKNFSFPWETEKDSKRASAIQRWSEWAAESQAEADSDGQPEVDVEPAKKRRPTRRVKS